MLDILHVSIPLDMDKLTEKQEDYVKMLINTIVHKKSAGFKEKGQIPPVVSLEISNIRLLLFLVSEATNYMMSKISLNMI